MGYDPEKAVAALPSRFPIALLPVRLETRFVLDTSPAVLKVRIYPDELVADLHDHRLTPDELEAGRAYWKAGWQFADEPAQWDLLEQRHGQRAAWIVERSAPNNLGSRPNGAPSFLGTPPLRDPSIATAVTRVLPDRWIVLAYRGGAEQHRVIGEPIPDPLQLSFRADLAEGGPGLVDLDELSIDEDLAWAIDFDRAVAAGMAVTIPLTGIDIRQGFDRLLVIGARTDLGAQDAGERFASLLDDHRYARGLAFVRQGTPTNSTAADPSGYPGPDDPARRFAIARGNALTVAGGDGLAVARALGIRSDVFAHVEGADRTEARNAADMASALWPCTLGYFLDKLWWPEVTAPTIARVRDHLERYVRGRGPLPAFRVGRVPYGLLPMTALSRWGPARGSDGFDKKLVDLITTWRGRWSERVADVPRVTATGHPDADLLGIFARTPSSREVRLREVRGPAFIGNLLLLLGINAPVDAARAALIAPILAGLGLASAQPRVAKVTLANLARRIRRPLVSAAPLSEEAPLNPNYIEELRGATIGDLRGTADPHHPAFGNPLLYHLLRQGALLEYARVTLQLAVEHKAVPIEHGREPELVGIAHGTKEWRGPWDRFGLKLPNLTGPLEIGQWLLERSDDPERAPVRSYRDVLGRLAALPTAELERLMTETLDTCSHRLDAWITSIATRRLLERRADYDEGLHLGGFGWVEDLRPRTARRTITAGGHIHAPSPTHATAAAILRNAHLTRTGADRARVAIDLSSRRVRGALELYDGVREGQPAGALLGYRFERALHDAQLDVYIDDFRRKFPLGRDPAAAPETATERIAARDVVDGLALRAALGGNVDPATLPWGTALPAVASGHRVAVAACLAALEDQVDASADLALAEAVFQAAQGNFDRAAATLAGLSGAGAVPSPQIAQVPRAGTTFTHRAVVILGEPRPDGTWPQHRRTKLAPRLDAWVGGLLGNPKRAIAQVRFADPGNPGGTIAREITIQELDLAALDVLALARAAGAGDGPDELAARLTRWAIDHGVPAPFQLDLSRPPGADRDVLGMGELVELARRVDALVTTARPLVAADLAPAGATVDPAPDTTVIDDRLPSILEGFEDLRHSLGTAIAGAAADLGPLRRALWIAVDHGVRGAVPVDLAGTGAAARDALVAQGERVAAELARRWAAAPPALDAAARLSALFGGTLPIEIPFTPPKRDELEKARQHSPDLPDTPDRPRRWLAGAARVRPRLAPLRGVALTTEAITAQPLPLAFYQLPFRGSERWIGLPFDATDPAARPRAGTLSLLVHAGHDLDVDTWSGLLLDEWTELIPGATQDTAFAVHHDAPIAEAPQCVVLAVSPEPTVDGGWRLDSLIQIVHDTLDLAKLRAVDGDQLGTLALVAPTIYLAANLANDTISVDLGAETVADTLIADPE